MKLFDILRLILTLMPVIEGLFGPKSGAAKKQAVSDAAKAVVDIVGAVSTGGQKQTWEKIKEPVGNIIDNAAAILFPEKSPDAAPAK